MSGSGRAYRLAPQAERDLEEIWLYTFENWSAEQADRYHDQIMAAIEGLAEGSKHGRAIDDIRPGYRKLTVASHFLFYRIADAGMIDIIRILHQRMDAASHLQDRVFGLPFCADEPQLLYRHSLDQRLPRRIDRAGVRRSAKVGNRNSNLRHDRIFPIQRL